MVWVFGKRKLERQQRREKSKELTCELEAARKKNAEAAERARKVMKDYLSRAVDDVSKEFG